MVPDRILPEEIKVMSVATEQLKQQIISHFRKCNLIQMDMEGKEKINGISVDEFIRTEELISLDHVKHCYTAV